MNRTGLILAGVVSIVVSVLTAIFVPWQFYLIVGCMVASFVFIVNTIHSESYGMTAVDMAIAFVFWPAVAFAITIGAITGIVGGITGSRINPYPYDEHLEEEPELDEEIGQDEHEYD